MALFSTKGSKLTGLADAQNRLATVIESGQLRNKLTGVGDTVASMESWVGSQRAAGASNHVADVEGILHSIWSAAALKNNAPVAPNIGVDGQYSSESMGSGGAQTKVVIDESYTPQQWDAGMAVLLTACNPTLMQKYAAEQFDTAVAKTDGVVTFGIPMSGNMDYRSHSAHLSTEAFDDRELEKHLPFSVVFNVQAARQSEFGELFYRTVVVTPDQNGVELSVRRPVVFNEQKHDITGTYRDWNRRNLIEATIDPSILANDATEIVPNFIVGNTENNEKFIDSALVAPVLVTNAGTQIQTAPLKPGIEIQLLGIGQNAAVAVGGQVGNTDSLDHMMKLRRAYFEIENANGDTAVISFNTERLPYAQFQKRTEEFDRAVYLNYTTKTLPITGATKSTTGGTNLAALAYLRDPARANWQVRLSVNITGNANTEIGNIQLNQATVTIDSVWDYTNPNDVVQITTPATLAALKAEFTRITFVGYDLRAYRSNINRRQRGLLTTTVEIRERYAIPLGAPITALTPLTDTKTTVDLTAPITCARIRNDLNAVATILEYGETLKTFADYSNTDVVDRTVPIPELEGIGRHVVRPYYLERTVDVYAEVQSLRSADRPADVSSVLINTIRDMAYKAYRDTGYEQALEAHTGVTGEKPLLGIGTDPYTARHLIVPGDTRTAAILFEHKVVTTPNQNMYGKIVMRFIRPNVTEPDALSSGFMAWMPELATTLPTSRNGEVVRELMVQPRTRHIDTCPIYMLINVQNLGIAVSRLTAFRTDELPLQAP